MSEIDTTAPERREATITVLADRRRAAADPATTSRADVDVALAADRSATTVDGERGTGRELASVPRQSEQPGTRSATASCDGIVALNEGAAVYDALAQSIRGSAVGWSDAALAQLERGLLDRYGPMIGGRHAVRRLVRLAARPPAA